MAENKNTFVNVDFSKDLELLKTLDEMVQEDDLDRSKFIRKLIRQEQGRRQQLPLPFPTTTKKNEKQLDPVTA